MYNTRRSEGQTTAFWMMEVIQNKRKIIRIKENAMWLSSKQ